MVLYDQPMKVVGVKMECAWQVGRFRCQSVEREWMVGEIVEVAERGFWLALKR